MMEPCQERETGISMLLSDDMAADARRELEDHLERCPACGQYLRELREDDRLLSDFADAMSPAIRRLEVKVLHTLKRDVSDTTSRASLLRRVLMGKPLLGLSMAASVAAIFVVVVLFGTPTSLYAQMTRAIQETRTLYAVGKTMKDGAWKPAYEIWYKRGVGLTVQQTGHGARRTMIDDGEYQWEYNEGSDSAVKIQSRNHHMVNELTEVLNLEEFRRLLANSPARSASVDGVKCQVYEWTDPEEEYRATVYIDGEMRARRYEDFGRENGEWVTLESCDFHYNVEIDDSRFVPNFGPDVSIVESGPSGSKAGSPEAEAIVEGQFDLNGAVYTREVLGLIFAVLESIRCSNGIIYLVCSIRPTDAVIQEFGEVSEHWNRYGDFSVVGAWKRFEGGALRSYNTPIVLAEAHRKGFSVSWILLLRKGIWPENEKQFLLSSYVHTRGKLQKKLEAQGATWYKHFNPLATLPLPEEDISLSEAIAKIHSQTYRVEPAMEEMRLHLGHEPSDERGPSGEKLYTLISSPPSRISVEEFERISRERIESRK